MSLGRASGQGRGAQRRGGGFGSGGGRGLGIVPDRGRGRGVAQGGGGRGPGLGRGSGRGVDRRWTGQTQDPLLGWPAPAAGRPPWSAAGRGVAARGVAHWGVPVGRAAAQPMRVPPESQAGSLPGKLSPSSPADASEREQALVAVVAHPESCIGCGACEYQCPYGAVSLVRGEGVRSALPVIDTDRCTGCGRCVDCCPQGVLALRPASSVADRTEDRS